MEGYNLTVKPWITFFLLGCFVIFAFLSSFADAETHYHEFVIEAVPVKRLCRTHSTITVNGQFPGPTLEVRNGDSLVIKVLNSARYNISLHWHGIRQLRNPWADGPTYVTQCPIQPGATYTYRFTIINQEGTLWWHAHTDWLRATVYGALIIHPKLGSPYPFSMPKQEYTILLGEWFDRNPMDVLRQAQFTGAAPNVSDAYTINGQPGDLYRCSSQETVRFPIESGETVLLRIINSALNQELFFAIANHKMTVVGVDAAYTKPFTTRIVMVGPGQTTNVLLTADQPPAHYYIAARAYNTAMNAAFDNTTTTAILEYKSAPAMPRMGNLQNQSYLNYQPTMIQPLRLLSMLGLRALPSPRCQGPNGTRFAASMNNVSFVLPRTNSIMQAYYQGAPGIFTTDFPPVPPIQFDYTGNVSRGLWQPVPGTKLFKLKYGSRVQIVLQDTSIVTTEDHPMHLHGYHFYVVGSGFGNFNPTRDTANFNLIDPPQRNTIGSNPGGWVAIRFVADNPGVWLMHCHLDSHFGLGLAMAFLVENGVGESQSVIPPPADLPPC
ncbi:hypothetical protein SLA2020_407300 [Shorea laevis]